MLILSPVRWATSFLLFSSLLPSILPYEISESLSGYVSAGEITYFTIESQKPIFVVLISQEGDADLYASPTYKNSKPSSDNHELSSVSCGLDILPMMMDNQVRKYTVGVHGHVRYDKSVFNLFIIESRDEDLRRYQVWDWDPETKQTILLIDAYPMLLLNDPKLNEVVRGLLHQSFDKTVTRNWFKEVLSLAGFVLLKLFEILIEILV